MTAEQEAIARLRERLEAWGEPRGTFEADLRALLDREARLTEALETMESDYAAFRKGLRAAIKSPSNPVVSDQWIIDSMKELDALRTIAAQLARVIRVVEWEGYTYNGADADSCSYCHVKRPEHSPHCGLAAALKAYGEIESPAVCEGCETRPASAFTADDIALCRECATEITNEC